MSFSNMDEIEKLYKLYAQAQSERGAQPDISIAMIKNEKDCFTIGFKAAICLFISVTK